MYLGLIPATSLRVFSECGAITSAGSGLTALGTAFEGCGGGTADSTTRSWTRSSLPLASLTAARIRSRKWPSIHSRVKSFGTATAKVSSSRDAPSTSPNQVE